MSSAERGNPLSAFAGELLIRVRSRTEAEMGTPGLGAFGRIVEEAIESVMEVIDPSLVNNPVGIPDCWCNLPSQRCACEIKYTSDGSVLLGDRDIEGIQSTGEAEGSRLIVLDVAFPPTVWVLDGTCLAPGELKPSAHARLHQVEEGQLVRDLLDRLLRRTDVDLIASESSAKQLLRNQAAEIDFRR